MLVVFTFCLVKFRLCIFLVTVFYRVEADLLNREREKLMKKLIEVEMDGQSAAKQASHLRELVRKFRQVCVLCPHILLLTHCSTY